VKSLSLLHIAAVAASILAAPDTAAFAEETASTKAYALSMSTMMDGMMIDPTGKPDLDFAKGMIPHHQGAIDMAKVELEFGKDPEIKKMAEGVVAAQTSEIELMTKWIATTDEKSLPPAPESVKANQQAMNTMMAGMMVTYSGNADVDFVTGMIPHHQGAIDMAKVELQYGKDATMQKLATDIVKAQESEITFMQDWLKKHR
jgi:uncharacterized protein (DUF305 family)